MDALYELDVWRRSKSLAVRIYQCLSACSDRGFKDQITRSAVSVPSNIAEGYERSSRRGFANFLRIARGSCAEFRTQVQIGQEIGYIEQKSAEEMYKEALEISKMLQGLIRRCKTPST